MAWPCASKPITYALSIRAGERAREKEGKRVGCDAGALLASMVSARHCASRGGGRVRKGGKEKRARVGEVERRSGDGSVAATACSVSLPRRSGRPVTPSLT